MELNTFIQSGLIEAYVLDQCTAEERTLVEQMRARYPEVRAELEAVQQALEGFAASHAVAPPPDLRGRILDALDQEPDPETPDADLPDTGTPALPGAVAPARRSALTWVLLALSAALGAVALWQNSQAKGFKEQIQQLEQQVNDCNSLRAATEEFLRDTSTRRVVLAAADPAVGGAIRAVTYHNQSKCENVLDLSTLPAPPAGKYYQFWAIVDKAPAPVSMGMVKLDSANALQKLPCRENAVAFAISLEDKPTESTAPTQVYLVGHI